MEVHTGEVHTGQFNIDENNPVEMRVFVCVMCHMRRRGRRKERLIE